MAAREAPLRGRGHAPFISIAPPTRPGRRGGKLPRSPHGNGEGGALTLTRSRLCSSARRRRQPGWGARTPPAGAAGASPLSLPHSRRGQAAELIARAAPAGPSRSAPPAPGCRPRERLPEAGEPPYPSPAAPGWRCRSQRRETQRNPAGNAREVRPGPGPATFDPADPQIPAEPPAPAPLPCGDALLCGKKHRFRTGRFTEKVRVFVSSTCTSLQGPPELAAKPRPESSVSDAGTQAAASTSVATRHSA
ncbi:basic proline-rich protein-like [Cuculus canorus]|uniref:basic proline-rich protein-like n=1 Tax=Cuculus canorus TaxID=55661 RepID=UPI0023AA2776|nr:basic proline-rich protein-like [Cuculus canorus]